MWKTAINDQDHECFGYQNTPGTAGGPGRRDRTLAVNHLFFLKKINLPPQFFLHIYSSYAKILGEKLFRTWEIP